MNSHLLLRINVGNIQPTLLQGDARLTPSVQTAADFDKAELPTEIAMFQGRDYRKAAQGKKAALGSIAEEWAQNNPRSNRHKSTLVKVGTDWVSAAFSFPPKP